MKSRDVLVSRLQTVVGPEYVLTRPEDVIVYEQDAFLVAHALPDIVVLPGAAAEVAAVVRAAHEAGVPLVARGAGTGLNGGSIPIAGGVMLVLTRMNRILEIDPRNRLAVVEPGVVNGDLTPAARASPPSVVTSATTPAGRTACRTGSPGTTCWRWRSCSHRGMSRGSAAAVSTLPV